MRGSSGPVRGPAAARAPRASGALSPRLRHRVVELVHGPGWRRVAMARRIGAGLLVTLALVLALSPGAGSGGVALLVTTHDVAAGATLRAEDLTVRHWPAELVPAGALRSAGDVEGRVLVGAARAGEPLTDLRIAGPELAATATGSPDSASVPVRLADAGVADLLRPGSAVDVVTVGPSTDEPVVLAGHAIVLTVLSPAGGAGFGSAARGPLVLVALPRESASRVAAAALSDQVALTLR
ncbi:SAF domain-containing protein [Pseudonocardia bannensis]|uniref:Flagellar biosynthesis protein FlgA n=1 Tax=Pseudonocardia bannensis TaxID=630973 RepID=A0A848DD50_9PSEU|nr:SAF domain-containing protein [Pseudonocardia bannensis]NMH90520.1 flagellar biosynthesis protein FlgA [Pseudonocardia bannensis]